jgi:hypothetical protein
MKPRPDRYSRAMRPSITYDDLLLLFVSLFIFNTTVKLLNS